MIKNLEEIKQNSVTSNIYTSTEEAIPTIIQLGYGELKALKIAYYLQEFFEKILDKCNELNIALPDNLFNELDNIALMIAKLETSINEQFEVWKQKDERLSGHGSGSVNEVLNQIRNSIEINANDLNYVLFENYYRTERVDGLNFSKYQWTDAPNLTNTKIEEDNKDNFNFIKKEETENINVLNLNATSQDKNASNSTNDEISLDELYGDLEQENNESNENGQENGQNTILENDVNNLDNENSIYNISESGSIYDNNDDLDVEMVDSKFIKNKNIEEEAIKQKEDNDTNNINNTNKTNTLKFQTTSQTTNTLNENTQIKKKKKKHHLAKKNNQQEHYQSQNQTISSSSSARIEVVTSANDRWGKLLKAMKIDNKK